MKRITPIASGSTENLVIADETKSFAFSADMNARTRKGVVTRIANRVGEIAIFYNVEEKVVCMPSVIVSAPESGADGEAAPLERDEVWRGDWIGQFDITNITTPDKCIPVDLAEEILGVNRGKMGFMSASQMPIEVEDEVFDEFLFQILAS
jgi:hypothetical protein